MDLMIIEGEKGKSEYTFWYTSIIQYKKDIELYPMGSVSYLEDCLLPLISTGKYRNVLILIDTTAYYRVVSHADKIIEKALFYIQRNQLNVRLSRLDYYCFEDCLLMFQNIKYWLYPKVTRDTVTHTNKSKSDMFEVLNNYLSLGAINAKSSSEDFNWAKNPILSNYVMRKTDSDHVKAMSKEKLAYIILNELTYHTKFYIEKGHLSSCWLCNCSNKGECSIAQYLTKIPRGHKTQALSRVECGLWKNKKDTKIKLADLFKYSVVLSKFRDSLGFR